MTNTWHKQQARRQPTIELFAKALKVLDQRGNNPYHPLNAVKSHPRHSKLIKTTADTGCMSCLSGTYLLEKLNLPKSALIPVHTQMRSANNEAIHIEGAILIELTGKDLYGKEYSTKQMVYISQSTQIFFLSRGALIDLGIISDRFPTLGEYENQTAAVGQGHPPVQKTKDTEVVTIELALCGCPKRKQPTPVTTPPFELSEVNRDKIEKFFLEHFQDSTFNVCTHQSLPEMHGPQMKLMVDSTAKPVAIHKAIPVPLHYQEEVKEGLDADVRLGVIEKVPQGCPTTWCHQMIICAKKCGSCRRTVDFQAINKLPQERRTTHLTNYI